MRYRELMKDYLTQQRQRAIHQRDAIKRRVREDIMALEQEIVLLSKVIREMEHDRLTEAKPVKPLTPEQTVKRAERDRKRQEQIRNVQSSARQRVADIQAKLGQ